jgi:prevent-host-death family protein
MTRMTTGKARQDFSDTVNRVAYQGERIILHRRGKDVAALVSVEDLKTLEALEDRLDNQAADLALKEAEEQGTTPWDEVKKDLGL